jgi:hypothetical protein
MYEHTPFCRDLQFLATKAAEDPTLMASYKYEPVLLFIEELFGELGNALSILQRSIRGQHD